MASVSVIPEPTAPLEPVVEQVQEVAAQLEEHSERSEERHEQILEGTQWLENRMDQLALSLTTLQSQGQKTQEELVEMRLDLTRELASLKSSQVMSPSTPPTSEIPIVEAPVEAEAESAEVVPLEAETGPPSMPVRKRRLI